MVIGGQTLTVPAQPQQTAKPNTKMVAYEPTVDQTDRNSEVEIMNSNDVTAAYEGYNKKLRSGIVGAPPVMPHPDEEPTIEQLTVLRAFAASGAPPSGDVSILAFHGLHIGVVGAIVLAEMKEPANNQEWLASWRIFKVACLMLKILSTAAAHAYSGHIPRLHTRYGSRVCSLLYQADIRFRSEHAERVRKEGEAMKAKAGVDPCEYDSDMHCEFVYKQATEDFAYWRREFESDALLILAHIDNTQSHLGPDTGSLTDVTKCDGLVEVVAAAQAHNGSRHRRVSDPKARTDRGSIPKGISWRIMGGTPLCFAFQTGECTEVTMVNNGPRCSRNTSRALQCARCLGSHPAKPKDGTACVVPPPQKTIRRESWGKSRGKGGEKY